MTQQPQTSKDAFDDRDEESNEGLRLAIAAEVLKNGPDTAIWLARRLKRKESSVWKRCSELVNAGILRKEGRKRNPGTPDKAGSEAALLHATDRTAGFVEGVEEADFAIANPVREAQHGIQKAARDLLRSCVPLKDGAFIDALRLDALKRAFERLDSLQAKPTPSLPVEPRMAVGQDQTAPAPAATALSPPDPAPPKPLPPHVVPLADQERIEAARMGVHIRRDGTRIEMAQMEDFHLLGSIRGYMKEGMAESVPCGLLILEARARGLVIPQVSKKPAP